MFLFLLVLQRPSFLIDYVVCFFLSFLQLLISWFKSLELYNPVFSNWLNPIFPFCLFFGMLTQSYAHCMYMLNYSGWIHHTIFETFVHILCEKWWRFELFTCVFDIVVVYGLVDDKRENKEHDIFMKLWFFFYEVVNLLDFL